MKSGASLAVITAAALAFGLPSIAMASSINGTMYPLLGEVSEPRSAGSVLKLSEVVEQATDLRIAQAGGSIGQMNMSPDRPDRYVIQNGDTLWAISGRFWGDAYFWPTLWSYNPYIGNAHLIFPGNVLKFSAGSYVRPPSMGFEDEMGAGSAGELMTSAAPEDVEEVFQTQPVGSGSDLACAPPLPFLEKGGGQVSVRIDGFLRESGFGPVGKVTKAPDSKVLLSSRDIVYLQFSRMDEVQCGQVYTVYAPTRKRISHPIYKRRVIGDLYRVLGDVQIIDINDFTATGRIGAVYGEITRGALVTPKVDLFRTVDIGVNSREVEGFIVQSLNLESTALSPNDVVYVDRGAEDGVGPGDTLYIVRQGDGLEGLLKEGERDISLPYQIVGKLVVITPGEFISEAVITEASDVIEVGDLVTTQVN